MIHAEFLQNLSSASTGDLSVKQLEAGMSTARRALNPPRASKLIYLQLARGNDDILDWSETSPPIPGMKMRRRGMGTSGDIANAISFEKIEPSQIASMLVRQDKKFTPEQGLFRVRDDFSLVECTSFPESGPVLLFIHGTFSNGENTIRSLKETSVGQQFLQDAATKYSKENILFFNHPTISVSPLLNAFVLQRIIGDSQASIDIITHSRGGLVTRWWCEGFDKQLDRCKNAILVGSPLAGTGLAAPPNIRKALKLLTNYGNALSGVVGLASAAVPIFGIVNTLLSVITSVTSIAAKTPIADGLIAMIPGLNGQSRVGNNQELLQLHLANGSSGRYAAVQANFQSEAPGWKFWKYFSKAHLVDTATDLISMAPIIA